MAEPTTPRTKTLKARCFCGAANYTVAIPTSSLPLRTHICNCSICRYTTGSLAIFHAPLPAGVSPEFSSSSPFDDLLADGTLTAYSREGAKVDGKRLFCSTCGAHVGAVVALGGGAPGAPKTRWAVSTSLFESEFQTDDTIIVTQQTFTESCPGGGLFSFWPDLPTWNPDPTDPEHAFADPAVVRPEKEFGEDGRERVRVACHCGGVSFTFPRPEGLEESLKEDPFVQRFFSPRDSGRKWIACLDACDDCRLVTGTHVIAWTFVPRRAISPELEDANFTLHGGLHGPPPPPSSSGGDGGGGEGGSGGGSGGSFVTLKLFRSTPGVVERHFCGRCGAQVFFAHSDRRPSPATEVVDVALGLVRAPGGPLAEDWVTWRAGRVAWFDSGMRFDARVTGPLSEGLKAWSLEKYGDAPSFSVG